MISNPIFLLVIVNLSPPTLQATPVRRDIIVNRNDVL